MAGMTVTEAQTLAATFDPSGRLAQLVASADADPAGHNDNVTSRDEVRDYVTHYPKVVVGIPEPTLKAFIASLAPATAPPPPQIRGDQRLAQVAVLIARADAKVAELQSSRHGAWDDDAVKGLLERAVIAANAIADSDAQAKAWGVLNAAIVRIGAETFPGPDDEPEFIRTPSLTTPSIYSAEPAVVRATIAPALDQLLAASRQAVVPCFDGDGSEPPGSISAVQRAFERTGDVLESLLQRDPSDATRSLVASYNAALVDASKLNYVVRLADDAQSEPLRLKLHAPITLP